MKNPQSSRLESFIAAPKKALWKLSLPIMMGMIVQNIYNIVDMIFVGRLGPEAIAALAFNLPMVFFAIGLIFGLGTGATAVIAQAIGANNKKRADNCAEHSLLLGVVLSVLIAIPGIIWGKSILTLIGTPPDILPLAYDYLHIYAAGIGFMITAVFFRSILSGEGDTTFPMIVMSIGTVLNIILDPIFIFTLGLEIKGAALATVISQAVVMGIFIYALFIKKHSYITFKLKDFSYTPEILKRIIMVGFPASLSMIIMSVGGVVFNLILVSFSPNAVAAYQVGGRLDFLALLPIFSIATGLMTLVGMFYGARRFNLLASIIRYGQLQAVLITSIIGALYFFFAEAIIPIFTDSEEIIEIATTYLRMIVFAMPVIAFGITSNRTMQGMGHSIPMLVTTTLRVIGISAPLALIFTKVLNKPLEFVWVAMIISSLISSSIAYIWMNNLLKQSRQDSGKPEMATASAIE